MTLKIIAHTQKKIAKRKIKKQYLRFHVRMGMDGYLYTLYDGLVTVLFYFITLRM